MANFLDNPPDSAQESGDMFLKPVTVPAASVNDTPLVCVQFNADYAAIFALALQRLLYSDAWAGTDAEVQRATTEIDGFIGDILGGNCP